MDKASSTNAGCPTTCVEGFTDQLLKLIPTLEKHGCSYGGPGGFVRRMREGTWMGHVMEHGSYDGLPRHPEEERRRISGSTPRP